MSQVAPIHSGSFLGMAFQTEGFKLLGDIKAGGFIESEEHTECDALLFSPFKIIEYVGITASAFYLLDTRRGLKDVTEGRW